MTYTPDDAQLIKDLELEWDVIDGFFGRFSTADWMRPHGKDWTFGDVPYHLMVFHNLFAESLRRGTNHDGEPEIRTLRELNQWNAARFQQRPTNQTGAQSFGLLKRSIENMHTAMRALGNPEPDMDRPCWLPLLRVRGVHTARIAIDYTYWHDWLHLCEANLRYNDHLPRYTDEMMHRALNFHMHITARSVDPSKITGDYVWHLDLLGNGGGAWTFNFSPNVPVLVQQGLIGTPNLHTTRTIADYLKLTAFNMMRINPLQTMFNSARSYEARKLAHIQALFNGSEDQVMQPIEDAEIEPEIVA